jgi:hypothetical protein
MTTLFAVLLAVLLVCGGGSATATLVGEQDVLDLFADLQLPFLIESVEDGVQGRVFRLRSAAPAAQSAASAIYLRATLTISTRGDGEAAAELERRLALADPDTGLSYAWDYVVAAADSIVHLHADCTFSAESFQKVALALARKLTSSEAAAPVSFWCRCGGGCRAGAPFPAGGAAERRVPPVRRPDGVEEGDYDNRLDPSGAWASPIGELALMHNANRLAFSYMAVFGETAHICEGAGVAGLVGRDRYEYPDEQGTVAFVITETEVRMELAEGIASFCGAGWAGDRFPTDRFQPPVDCTVATEHSHFHVVDTLELERTPFTVGMGSTVEVVPARHTGDETWVIARHVGPWKTAQGLLDRRHLDCPAAPTSVLQTP